MVQINQVLNNNLNSMNNIARYVKTCGKKSILETKPFRGKFEPNKLGYILSDGTINFSSVKTAFEYGKNKCIQALNSSNPYEHGVIISGTRVLEELVGTISSCPFIPMKYKTNITFLHGHPDMYAKGGSTPVSIADFRSLVGNILMNRNVDEIVAFNSKGEYSKLSKKVKKPKNKISLIWNYIKYSRIEKKEQKMLSKSSIAPLLKKRKSLQKRLRTKDGINEMVFNQILEIDKQIASFKVSESDCKIIHEFWKKNASSLGVIYETNFSDLI